VVTNARAIYTTRAAAGALAPGIPHALFGRQVLQNSGVSRRENAESYLSQRDRATFSAVVTRESG